MTGRSRADAPTTNAAQIDATYGHLLPDSEDYLRGLLGADAQRIGAESEAF